MKGKEMAHSTDVCLIQDAKPSPLTLPLVCVEVTGLHPPWELLSSQKLVHWDICEMDDNLLGPVASDGGAGG